MAAGQRKRPPMPKNLSFASSTSAEGVWGLVDSVAGCEGNRDLTQEQVVYTTTTTRRGGNGALDTSVMLAPRSLRQPSKSRSVSDQSVYRAVFSCILGPTTAA